MNEGQTRILVVEDDPVDFALLKKAFDSASANVELFHCQAAADTVEMLEARACRILLLDLNIGGRSGRDVLVQLRKHEKFRTLPVIIFTSSGSAQDITACYEAGANAYSEKPLTMEDYRRFANVFCDFWLASAIIP